MADDDDKLEHLTEQELAFMEAGGGARMTRSRFVGRTSSKPRPKAYKPRRKTGGALRPGVTVACIYVATDRTGRVKIGMAADGDKRAYGLHAELRLAVPVAASAALHVETEAFNILGHSLEHGEWVDAPLGKAMAAVWLAKARSARVMAVEPGLSAENARLMRIGLAELKIRE